MSGSDLSVVSDHCALVEGPPNEGGSSLSLHHCSESQINSGFCGCNDSIVQPRLRRYLRGTKGIRWGSSVLICTGIVDLHSLAWDSGLWRAYELAPKYFGTFLVFRNLFPSRKKYLQLKHGVDGVEIAGSDGYYKVIISGCKLDDHDGEIICRAVNEHGAAESRARLTVEPMEEESRSAPTFIKDIEDQVRGSRWICFRDEGASYSHGWANRHQLRLRHRFATSDFVFRKTGIIEVLS